MYDSDFGEKYDEQMERERMRLDPQEQREAPEPSWEGACEALAEMNPKQRAALEEIALDAARDAVHEDSVGSALDALGTDPLRQRNADAELGRVVREAYQRSMIEQVPQNFRSEL